MSFYSFLNNSYKNIKGITIIDSGKKGKNVGILAITHGNEYVGLQVFDFLLKEFNLKSKLKKGKIFLISVNINAYKNFIESGDINKFRFIDDNMNRISNKSNKLGSYEFKRLNELKLVFDELDLVIDLHSVSKGREVICITDDRYLEKSKKIFNVETILVDNLLNKGALISYFLRNGKEAYGLECGNHIDEKGLLIGYTNVLNLLINEKFIDGKIKKSINPLIYKFIKEIYPKTDFFKYLKDYKGFTKIEVGEKFAIDGDNYIKNSTEDTLYLGLVKKIPMKGDGVGFLFKKLL